MVLANLLAWKSKVFCDFYVAHIYPLWVNTYGRVMGLFPFSVGEIMVAAGAVLTAAVMLLAVVYGIIWMEERQQGMSRPAGESRTLNCFIPYHCSALEEKYGILCREMEEGFAVGDLLSKEYTLEELSRLRDYVVIKANELAVQVERDEAGRIIEPGILFIRQTWKKR